MSYSSVHFQDIGLLNLVTQLLHPVLQPLNVSVLSPLHILQAP